VGRLWHELVSDAEAPYDLTLALAVGEEVQAAAPFPYLKVVTVAPLTPLVLKRQVLEVEAFDPGRPERPPDRLVIGRIVAVAEDGSEHELQREVIPVGGDDEMIDLTECAACHRGFPGGMHIVREGKAYHKDCWNEADHA